MPTVVDHPLVLHKLTILRARETDTPTFRRTLREIGWLLGAAATRDLPLATRRIDTPLTAMDAPVLAGPPPAVISILRAGNGLLDGILDLIPDAAVGHVGLQRDHATLEAVHYYEKFPDRMDERTVLVVDPMLATGNSAAAAVDRVRAAGAHRLRLVCLLAAPEGLAAFAARHPDVSVVTGAVDERLNENGYILPGLGDAGDRMYGTA